MAKERPEQVALQAQLLANHSLVQVDAIRVRDRIHIGIGNDATRIFVRDELDAGHSDLIVGGRRRAPARIAIAALPEQTTWIAGAYLDFTR